ncbi:asparagine synthase-related protein [Halothermothrix orenii]|uniref:asparagine synthase (glutamine-hydrolyzing) n=1 Tax=Halothermothrix orenii (strain H 168 / OCM 544 / DSM 9562) TaxID=373903 RepID=B8D0Q0_HALOH|nr:asparagine synthase-related protein [Halothermothrix orenii]ACL70986.1 asparagine synthase (glutamine-hydrolysing) [Halothermothrix orenii H 168]
MSGIAGVYEDDDPGLVRDVLKKMEHRGPESTRIYKAPKGVLGCTRIKGKGDYSPKEVIAISDGRVVVEGKKDSSGYGQWVKGNSEIIELYNKFGKECVHYFNGPFAIAIFDGENIFVARDPLGLKPLYYSNIGEKFVFASEIKGLAQFDSEIKTFPPGHYYHSEVGFQEYFKGVSHKQRITSVDKGVKRLRNLLIKTVKRRIGGIDNPGIYLSGGIDSSTIVAAASKVKEVIKTFAVGAKGSNDLEKARLVADHLGTDHYEYRYTVEEALEIVPEVIYQLESFDQYLVRSSIANYFVGRLAKETGVELVLCGEGGDELFGGYHYLKDMQSLADIREELEVLTMSGHSNGFQRVDRMNMAHSLLYDMPFMDKEIVKFAFSIPVKWKLYGNKPVEKWILRKAFEDDLPDEIIWRKKAKFFEGSNTTDTIKSKIESFISDKEFKKEKKISDDVTLRSKEELYYYRIFREYYPHRSILDTIGRTRTVN